MPFIHEKCRSGGIPPPDLSGSASGINKSSSDDRPCRDFCWQKSERRKGRGVARASENIRWMFVPKQQGFSPPDLSGSAPGINKSSSDDRPCRDFCWQKSERRKGRGVARASENIRWMFVPKQQGFSPPDLSGSAPGINKSSSDDRPCRDFC